MCVECLFLYVAKTENIPPTSFVVQRAKTGKKTREHLLEEQFVASLHALAYTQLVIEQLKHLTTRKILQ